ncbi:MAG: sensor histidine kinase KdpD [Rhodospirillaceae bacterium]|nr:sensor histidine kinase KdpD [Rhodospirillaceae bacterium]
MPPIQTTDLDSARPSPEALLASATSEHRGRLKIFLGAAPGVGKTYEMLLAGRARRKEGADVVIGVVETHKRAETEALLEGFEIIPKRAIEYRDRMLQEMDIDAILARKPQLVLVDELAHTNAPGSRHDKRWQDVAELLEADIDVYATLNIQHLESLNDVVAQITTVRVRETLPDEAIDKADEVELVDLTPKDLIQRLHEGKVYVPEVAQRALGHYFSEGNLTALRELALRRTAQRVDDQMLTYMQAHAIPGPWAAGERILVCVNEHPSAAGLIRHARRAADRLQARWVALYIESPRSHQLPEADKNRVAQTLRLAERLGATAVTLPGRDIASDVLNYARANNITQIIIGKSRRTRLFELLHGSVVDTLVRKSGAIAVQVLASEAVESEGGGTALRPQAQPFAIRPYAEALPLVTLATAVGYAFDRQIDLPNISMIFIPVVLYSAIRHGLLPSLFATALSTLAYNFFFLEPLYTFTIQDPQNVVALLFLLLVAVIASQLAAQSRAQAQAARRQAASTAALYGFSRKIAGIGILDDLLWAVAHQIAAMLKLHVVLLLPEAGELKVHVGYPPEDELDEADLAAAKWSWSHGQPAGRSSDTLPGARRLFLPLRTERGLVGIMGLDRPRVAQSPGPEAEQRAILTPDERRLLDALADQAAVAIERITLAADIDQAKVEGETERLRSALLTSISHDLKTPLASIIGSITSLRKFWPSFDEPTRDELLGTVQEEAERLTRFVGNVLDMTRLEAKSVTPQLLPVDLAEILGTVAGDARRALALPGLTIETAADLPPALIDAHLFRQVMFNLLDNAAKYAPDGAVRVVARAVPRGVAVEVLDEGPGIPPGDLARIFDKFFRLEVGDRRRAGTGLGLSICKGFVAAMGGSIVAENRADRPAGKSGALFRVTLPAAPASLPPPEELPE